MGHDQSQTASSDTATLAQRQQRQDSEESPEQRWRRYELEDIDFSSVAPPIEFGPRRAFYQYSVGVPQFHLILVSVLQSIVFGMLVTNLPPLPQWSEVNARGLDFVLAAAPYLLSALIVLIVWVDFVYVSAVLVWPARFWYAFLIYSVTFTEVFMVRAIIEPGQIDIPKWVFGVGLVVGVSGLVRLSNRSYFRPGSSQFVDEEVRNWVWGREKILAVLYVVLGAIGMALGFFYTNLLHLFSIAFDNIPGNTLSLISAEQAFKGITYGVTLFAVVFSIKFERDFYERFLRRVFEGKPTEKPRTSEVRIEGNGNILANREVVGERLLEEDRRKLSES
jgi:hypothetical protein